MLIIPAWYVKKIRCTSLFLSAKSFFIYCREQWQSHREAKHNKIQFSIFNFQVPWKVKLHVEDWIRQRKPKISVPFSLFCRLWTCSNHWYFRFSFRILSANTNVVSRPNSVCPRDLIWDSFFSLNLVIWWSNIDWILWVARVIYNFKWRIVSLKNPTAF